MRSRVISTINIEYRIGNSRLVVEAPDNIVESSRISNSEFATILTSSDKVRKRTFKELIEISISSGSKAEVIRTRVPISTIDLLIAIRY